MLSNCFPRYKPLPSPPLPPLPSLPFTPSLFFLLSWPFSSFLPKCRLGRWVGADGGGEAGGGGGVGWWWWGNKGKHLSNLQRAHWYVEWTLVCGLWLKLFQGKTISFLLHSQGLGKHQQPGGPGLAWFGPARLDSARPGALPSCDSIRNLPKSRNGLSVVMSQSVARPPLCNLPAIFTVFFSVGRTGGGRLRLQKQGAAAS